METRARANGPVSAARDGLRMTYAAVAGIPFREFTRSGILRGENVHMEHGMTYSVPIGIFTATIHLRVEGREN